MNKKLEEEILKRCRARGLPNMTTVNIQWAEQIIQGLTPAQRWVIRAVYGLTGNPAGMTVAEFALANGDKNPLSAQQIHDAGVNTLSFRVWVKRNERFTDGAVTVTLADNQRDHLSRSVYEFNWDRRLLERFAELNTNFIGDLVQLTEQDIRKPGMVGNKGIQSIVLLLEELDGLELGLVLTEDDWTRPPEPRLISVPR